MSTLAKGAVGWCLMLMFELTSASSIGVVGGLPSSGTGAESIGVRERVALVRAGGLLVGRPTKSVVRLIVVDAPDASDHLLMREIRTADGRLSVLFTAPAALAGQVRRATLYLEADGRDRVLLGYDKGQSVSHAPQRVALGKPGTAGDTGIDALLAFPVSGLGPFWLVDESMAAAMTENAQSARSLLGAEAPRAFLYIAAIVLALVLGRLASVWAHRRDRHVC